MPYETDENTCPIIGAFIETLDDRGVAAVPAMAKTAKGTRCSMILIGKQPILDEEGNETGEEDSYVFGEAEVERAMKIVQATVKVYAAAGLRALDKTQHAAAFEAAVDFDGHDEDEGDPDDHEAAYLIAYRATYALNVERGGHAAAVITRGAGDASRLIADAELNAAYIEIDGKEIRYFNDVDFAIKAVRSAGHCIADAAGADPSLLDGIESFVGGLCPA